jgi:ubiquitin C-terminal hydrolase
MNMLNKIWLVVAAGSFTLGLHAEMVMPTTRTLPDVVGKVSAPSLSGLGMGASKSIVATELNLYGLLRLVAFNIDNQSKQLLLEASPSTDRQTMLGAAFQLATESMKLFAAIVDGFNKGGFYYNPELKYRFITVCNAIDIKEPIEPCDLRRLSSQLKVFCRQVKAYSNSHKGFLSKEDGELSDKIINLGNALTSGLLREEFFDIDWADRLVDWTVHRPAEFVSDNKELVITLGIVSIAALGVWWYSEKKNASNLGQPVLQQPDQRAQPPAAAVVGLQNGDGWFWPSTSNNCWLNSAAQCLFRVNGINGVDAGSVPQIDALLRSAAINDYNSGQVLRTWGNLLTDLHPPVADPTQFHLAVRNAYFGGDRYAQQDASEFITNFFGDMRERLHIHPFNIPVHEVITSGVCPCGSALVRENGPQTTPPTLVLHIPPMANRNPTLEDCLRRYFAPTAILHAHPVCHDQVQRTTQNQLDAYPAVLVVSLNRFEQRDQVNPDGSQVMVATDRTLQNGQKVAAMVPAPPYLAKIQTPVAIPPTFDLATCCGDHHPDGDGQYDLVGVVLHGGRVLNGGHYVALTRAHDDTWHYFSDRQTAPVNNIQESLAAGVYQDEHYNWVDKQDGRRYDPVPYVLFYRRRNIPPVQPPVVVTPPGTPIKRAAASTPSTTTPGKTAAPTTPPVLVSTQKPVVLASQSGSQIGGTLTNGKSSVPVSHVVSQPSLSATSGAGLSGSQGSMMTGSGVGGSVPLQAHAAVSAPSASSSTVSSFASSNNGSVSSTFAS